MDHQQVVALVGQSATTAIGSDYQQEVDVMSLFKDVAREYCKQISNPIAARHVIDRAFRIAPNPHVRDPAQGRAGREGRRRAKLMADTILPHHHEKR
jgi:hypothetical protein